MSTGTRFFTVEDLALRESLYRARHVNITNAILVACQKTGRPIVHATLEMSALTAEDFVGYPKFKDENDVK
jgi:hypothetical protein